MLSSDEVELAEEKVADGPDRKKMTTVKEETLIYRDMMVFEKWELQMFETLAPYLNKNPRKVKRVTNVYTMVRSLSKAQDEVETKALRKRLLVWYVPLAQRFQFMMFLTRHHDPAGSFCVSNGQCM